MAGTNVMFLSFERARRGELMLVRDNLVSYSVPALKFEICCMKFSLMHYLCTVGR